LPRCRVLPSRIAAARPTSWEPHRKRASKTGALAELFDSSHPHLFFLGTHPSLALSPPPPSDQTLPRPSQSPQRTTQRSHSRSGNRIYLFDPYLAQFLTASPRKRRPTLQTAAAPRTRVAAAARRRSRCLPLLCRLPARQLLVSTGPSCSPCQTRASSRLTKSTAHPRTSSKSRYVGPRSRAGELLRTLKAQNPPWARVQTPATTPRPTSHCFRPRRKVNRKDGVAKKVRTLLTAASSLRSAIRAPMASAATCTPTMRYSAGPTSQPSS
jgi:hypothetical protein